MQSQETLREALFQETLRARHRVYEVGRSTPLERLQLEDDTEQVYLKREDCSPIRAYKWRGAYHCIASLDPAAREAGVVAASAGNHAQGVALAASRLGIRATIFMPHSTPLMKQEAVRRLGRGCIDVKLVGDSYDAASQAAHAFAATHRLTPIHPYDDLAVMGGQGTLADEIVMAGEGSFERIYLQIGGGGMAAGVACWLKRFFPSIEVIGVEGVEQASMAAAIRAGGPVTLDYVDVFCDGTAVRRAGDLTWRLCRDLIDRFITVTNEEVCAAIQLLWERHRIIPEPAGAMGLAGWLKERAQQPPRRTLAIICGANMDFGQLSWIVRHAGIGLHTRRYYRFAIPEHPGSLLDLLERHLDGINIIEFQYGQVGRETGFPVIGLEAPPQTFEKLGRNLEAAGHSFADITGDEDVEFRIIRYDPTLFRHPLFFTVEFPERAGALHDFLAASGPAADIVYFNYSYSGERVGRALLGFNFDTAEKLAAYRGNFAGRHPGLRAVRFLKPEVGRRLL